MKPLSIRSKQRGFTLIEVGIALTIGLVIIMGVARGIQAAQEKSVIAQVMDDVQLMRFAHDEVDAYWSSIDGGYGQGNILISGTNAFNQLGIPSSDNAPWGVLYDVHLDDAGNSLVILVPEVPENIKGQLRQRMRSLGTVTPVDSGLQITFSRYGDSNT